MSANKYKCGKVVDCLKVTNIIVVFIVQLGDKYKDKTVKLLFLLFIVYASGLSMKNNNQSLF